MRRDPDDLTRRTREVLAALERLVERDGFAPTMRELASEVGLRSPSSVHQNVEVLEEAQLIERLPARPRALRLTTDRHEPSVAVSGSVPRSR